MPSFSTTLEKAIHAALALANDRHHEFATLEHLLLTLLDEPDAKKVMQACSVDADELRGALVKFIDEELANLITDIDGSEAVPTAAFQRVIQRAAIHVQSSGRTEVTGANVIVAIFALKIAPRRFSGDVFGIEVIIFPAIRPHRCSGIREWFPYRKRMWCFTMPLRQGPNLRKLFQGVMVPEAWCLEV